MSNKVKDINIKNRTYYFFDDILYPLNPLSLIFNKVNGYFEEINENKYLTLVPTDETKEKI